MDRAREAAAAEFLCMRNFLIASLNRISLSLFSLYFLYFVSCNVVYELRERETDPNYLMREGESGESGAVRESA